MDLNVEPARTRYEPAPYASGDREKILILSHSAIYVMT